MKIKLSLTVRAAFAAAAFAPALAIGAPTVGGCPVFPADNIWNTRVDNLPVHANSAAYVASIGANGNLFMDWGSGLFPSPPDPDAAPIGIPFVLVPGSQPKVPVNFFDYGDESDSAPNVPAIAGPGGTYTANYPIPSNAPIEGAGPSTPLDAGGDRHVLVIDTTNCILYETGNNYVPGVRGPTWNASGGAVFDLKVNGPLRPAGWTSADAAGLPIFPGLVRYDEANDPVNGIQHALRFTASVTQRAYVWPATHFASSNPDTNRPPMGMRFRLKASKDISAFNPRAKAIAQAMKTYGIILADNGSNWFVSGAPDERWVNSERNQINSLKGSDFEAVDVTSLIVSPTSGQAANPSDTTPNQFGFAALANAAPGSTVTSNTITVSGIGGPAAITVTGGSYSIGCTATFTATAATITNGQTVCVRHTASASNSTGTSTTLTIGGISATFTSTTYSSTFLSGVSNTITHYYQSILRRAPDSGGAAFWQGEALRVSGLGASVNEAFFSLAASFYASAEYAAFNRNNTGFVTDLYTTFFNRAPDSGGLNFWVNNLNQGMPREVALAEFLFSAEFATYMQGIFGNTAARAEVNAAIDFYRGLLARLPDDGGFNFWVGRFRIAQCAGAASITTEVEAISSAFALSGEYAARGRTNAQYVGDLYNAFLRRGGDLAGVQFWIGQLNSAAQTREQLRVQFKNSAEFQARVNAIIAQGCL